MKKLFFILVVFTMVFASCKKEDTKTEILSGKTAPATTVGGVGDFYLDQSTNTLYGPKTSSGWGNGIHLTGQILNGNGAPAASAGEAGDYYLDNTNNLLYGPKATAWGAGLQLGAPCEVYLFTNPYHYVLQYSTGQFKVPYSAFNYTTQKADSSLSLTYIKKGGTWQLANGSVGYSSADFVARYNFDNSEKAMYMYLQPADGSYWPSEASLEGVTDLDGLKIVVVPGGKITTIAKLSDKSFENVMSSLSY